MEIFHTIQTKVDESFETASKVVIAVLDPGDVSAVRDLLVAGLTERWGHYDASLNPDITSFPAAYRRDLTLVAREDGRVVGTGTLRLLGDGVAEVVCMSVAAEYRRSGIGSRLLRQLLEHAGQQSVREITLETTSTWTSAVEFYVRHGFRKTHEVGDDSYFALTLSPA